MTKLTDILKRPFWGILPNGLREILLATPEEIEKRKARLATPLSQGMSKGVVSNRVMVIPVLDVLTLDSFWGSSYTDIGNALEAAKDPSVEQVILYVDSPGGEVTGLPETAALVAEVAKLKPVTAVVAGIAASAAYWLVSQATKIVVTPSGSVGSVGVRIIHADISQMLEDAGIKVTEMFAGDFKTEWTPFAPLTEEAKASMQKELDAIYADFLAAVASGRGNRLTKNAIAGKFGNGRMRAAESALTDGMVDAVQSPRDFFKNLTPAEKTGMAFAEDYTSTNGARRAELERKRF